MREHIKAWKEESKHWKGGNYSLELPGSCCKGRLLDAGCGSGKYALPLRMRGFEVVALDVSHHALKTAEERCARLNLDIDPVAANVYEIPFKNGCFDVIWCYGVLQHLLLKERELAIHEFMRLLKHDGLLFIEVMGEKDMRFGGSEIEHNTFSRKNGIVYHYFNTDELKELLHGFSCSITESRKEKVFEGERYVRHTISAVAKKP